MFFYLSFEQAQFGCAAYQDYAQGLHIYVNIIAKKLYGKLNCHYKIALIYSLNYIILFPSATLKSNLIGVILFPVENSAQPTFLLNNESLSNFPYYQNKLAQTVYYLVF